MKVAVIGVVVGLSVACAMAADVDRVVVGPRVIITNGASVSALNRSMQPALPMPSSIIGSPAPITNFGSITGPGNGHTVPDTHGTVGTNAVMTLLNWGFNMQT